MLPSPSAPRTAHPSAKDADREKESEREYGRPVFKIFLIGDCHVGKTNLLLRFTQDRFTEKYISTIGDDHLSKDLTVDGTTVTLQIWDTAGQERFSRAVTSSYYRGAQAVCVVYDISSHESFANVQDWLCEVLRFVDSSTRILLVGNKSDLESDRSVAVEESRVFAEANDMACVETSAKTGKGVYDMFEGLTREIMMHLPVCTRLPSLAVTDFIKVMERKKQVGEEGGEGGEPACVCSGGK